MLSVQQLSATYHPGERDVLHDVSLQVARGEVMAVIGPNGCGKSTLLRCIAGLLAPRFGTLLVGGDNVARMSARSRAQLIALLPQQFAGDDELPVREAVLLGRTPYLGAYGTPSAHDRAVVENALQATRTLPFAQRAIGELSGGERQRVALARALAQQAKVLLLDEPTSNLDIRYQHELLHLVRAVARRDNLAVIVVLHQINLAAAVADSMTLLDSTGQVRAQGTPSVVMTREHLEAVYEMELRIGLHPRHGRPQAQADYDFEAPLPSLLEEDVEVS